MSSSFQQRKAALAFYRYDQTGDGLIREEDIDLIGERVAQSLSLEQGTDRYDRVVKGMHRIWDAYFATSAKEGNGAVTLQQNLTMVEAFLAHPNAWQMAQDVNQPIFEALDLTGDGTISLDEYSAFVTALGATKEEARTGFQQIDTNGDGKLSPLEFATAWTEYYQADDRTTAGNHFYGYGKM